VSCPSSVTWSATNGGPDNPTDPDASVRSKRVLELVVWAEVLAVFAFARLATAIPLTPGGLGFVEGVLAIGLVGAGGPR
jgi:hypothetical protein